MESLYSPANRAERLIASGRVVLAASSLFAVWLDPTEPAKYASVAYSLLAAYLAYAIAIALWVVQSAAVPRSQRLLSHAFDLAFFSLFTYFTSGPASPFIAYFVFSLVCATLRWQWRGTFWTALVALGTFLGLGVYFAEVLHDPGFQSTPFIIRSVYLAVFAVLLGYLGAHEERTRREMAQLASWPDAGTESVAEVARALLGTAARILEAPRVLAIWADREEPWAQVARLDGERFACERERSLDVDALVAPELRSVPFLHAPERRRPSPVLVKSSGRLERWRGTPLVPELALRLGDGPVLSCPLQGEIISGRLFFAGKRNPTSDDLVLGEIVASIVAARLDHVDLIARLRSAAAAEERVRLARDLHDGVLQSFTGIGLRVAAARRLADGAANPVAGNLSELQTLLAEEQRDLRFLIEELESPTVEGDGSPAAIAERLRELAERIEQTWGLKVQLRLRDLPGEPSASSSRELYAMVREAIVNAARHSGASCVEVDVGGTPAGEFAIAVADDGGGFPFSGRFELAELERRDLGPRTLRARLRELGGSLTLQSSERGSRIEMRLPATRVPA